MHLHRIRRPILALALSLLALPAALPAFAESHLDTPDEAYAYWHDTYADWDRADVEAAGYVIDQTCVSAAAEGLPAKLGAMGYHAVNPGFATSGELKVEEPHIILLDADDNVIGVEYEAPTVTDPAPEIAGTKLVFTPPHPGVDHDHMSLHIYFVGDEDERYGTWNTAVSCPAEDEAAMHDHEADTDADADADAADDADDHGSDDHDGFVAVSGAQPDGMPTTGIAELPGGGSGLLAAAAALMLGLALVGRGLSRRYEDR